MKELKNIIYAPVKKVKGDLGAQVIPIENNESHGRCMKCYLEIERILVGRRYELSLKYVESEIRKAVKLRI